MPVSIEYYNFWSKNDFAIRYIYQLIRLGSTAVGSCDFPILSGHEILNINATKFVKSHMDFRANLYSIGLLTGMAYD